MAKDSPAPSTITESTTATTDDGSSTKADHLCVLIHGLWGNPTHLAHLSTSLSTKYPSSRLKVLVAKSNAGSFTYDGVEVGGERVTHEIESELGALKSSGHNITKLSIVGYSLGGLIARYAVGLLFSKGWFQKLQPMNFTSFASPHLGVRTPTVSWGSNVWNVIGARTLSMSGQQLFTVDRFRDTGRPLLSVMCDPGSIFMRGLAAFKHRSLYCNIVNDRSAPYYTTAITETDPYKDLDYIRINYLEGYEPIMVDHSDPVQEVTAQVQLGLWERLTTRGGAFAERIPYFLLMSLLIPVGFSVFAVNAGIQTFTSARRIQAHQSGLAGIAKGNYLFPLMIEDAHEENNSDDGGVIVEPKSESAHSPSHSHARPSRTRAKSFRRIEFPKLKLDPLQVEMVDRLGALGWSKYPVHIHKIRHSHAAIIRRMAANRYEEGLTVSRHWLDEDFEI